MEGNERRTKVTDKKIILGSASPRRRELLSQIGVPYEVRVSDKEETYQSSSPKEIVKELALMKARNVAEDLKEENGRFCSGAVIGADTIVALDDQVLGKPKDEEDAFRMLRNLQGREHRVFTGVAVLDFDDRGDMRVFNYAVETTVYVNKMSDQEIAAYIRTGEPMDKAGAYGIQGRFAAYIERIDGDYYNVVGLPVSKLYQTLKEAGYIPV